MPTKCYSFVTVLYFFRYFFLRFLLVIIPSPVRKVAQKNLLNSSGSYPLSCLPKSLDQLHQQIIADGPRPKHSQNGPIFVSCKMP